MNASSWPFMVLDANVVYIRWNRVLGRNRFLIPHWGLSPHEISLALKVGCATLESALFAQNRKSEDGTDGV
jgi:hypothetical protein